MTKVEKTLKAVSKLDDTEKESRAFTITSDYKMENPLGFIQNTVCNHLNVSAEMLSLNTRKKKIVYARYIIMYFARKHTTFSLEEIGQFTGGKDHATVLHGCNRIEQLIKESEGVKYVIKEVESKLKF